MARTAADVKRILFALKADWIGPVNERLDRTRYEATFRNFRQAPPFGYFDCIVPLYLNDYPPLWRYRWRAECLIPSEAVVMLTDDKPRFMQFLRDNGFAEFAPEIYMNVVQYPFIYKKRSDIAGKNSHIIATPDARAALEAEIAPDDYFMQECVGGRTEYTTHFLAVDGRPSFDSTLEFIFERDAYVRGIRCEPLETRKIETPSVDLFRRILKALNYTGTACFNYKIADGAPKIFELNPRAGGSLRLDLNAYLDAYLSVLEVRHTFASRVMHPVRRRLIRLPPPPQRKDASASAPQTQTA
jgi:hypothetical protein